MDRLLKNYVMRLKKNYLKNLKKMKNIKVQKWQLIYKANTSLTLYTFVYNKNKSVSINFYLK